MPEWNNRNAPVPDGPRQIGHIIHEERHHYQGPLPRPEDFAAYERVLAGAGDRILKMAENQAAHRQGMERRALSGDIAKSMMGTVLAYITFGGSMFGAVYLLLHDKPIQSLVALITALGAAFGPKICADFVQPRSTGALQPSDTTEDGR
jgi:uncharacterized membrane protein